MLRLRAKKRSGIALKTIFDTIHHPRRQTKPFRHIRLSKTKNNQKQDTHTHLTRTEHITQLSEWMKSIAINQLPTNILFFCISIKSNQLLCFFLSFFFLLFLTYYETKITQKINQYIKIIVKRLIRLEYYQFTRHTLHAL